MINGKDLKALAKNNACLVIHFNLSEGCILKASNNNYAEKTQVQTEVVYQDRDRTLHNGSFCALHAFNWDGELGYLVHSVKPTDNITFSVRDNGTDQLRKAGFRAQELRARVTTKGGKMYELTLHTMMGKDGNPHFIE